MDFGGRFSRSLTARHKPVRAAERAPPSRFVLFLHRARIRFGETRFLRGAEIVSVIALFAATGAYGVVRGGHSGAVIEAVTDVGDALANAAGFRIQAIEITGAERLTRAEILSAAGIGEHTSLLWINADAARARLKRDPRIAEAAVRKLYPGRLEISLEERNAFALWQHDRQLDLVARDGGVLASVARDDARKMDLPLVVGLGAATRAATLLAALDSAPEIRAQTAAAILIAERRWNLRLKNGMDVRLPEIDPAAALARLVVLDREQKILTRDVSVIDLRLADRTLVRLSPEAAAERAAALKARLPKRKGEET
jgi:cell division protein FtsQ